LQIGESRFGAVKQTFAASISMDALSKVCGCCQRELQRRQIRQGGKRGLFAVLWGLSVTAALIDAVRNRSDGLLEHRAIVLPDLPPVLCHYFQRF
jgi:hypothetical protein